MSFLIWHSIALISVMAVGFAMGWISAKAKIKNLVKKIS
tara:strand:+ start:572 stop:688 length:117 start_codon:yes stop_codon:yes gene_type:complete